MHDAPAQPAARVRLDLGAPRSGDEPVLENLSVVSCSGDCLWTASDETASIERLIRQPDGSYGDHASYALGELFDLPDGGAEVDVEGLSVSDGYLWVTGSHSLRRSKPKPKEHSAEEVLERLCDVRCDRNRFLLGRIPLVESDRPGVFGLGRDAEGPGGPRRAGCLKFKKDGNTLSRALSRDDHVGLFMGIPAKENGFDIEGIAARGERAFVGLRGPVLRGLAMLIDIRVRDRGDGRLRLEKHGEGGRRYRKRFVDFDGLGVRELCFDGDDLLVLAGPTMDLDGPVALYRWRGACSSEGEGLVPPDQVERVLSLPYGPGVDHAEGMTLVREGDRARLLVVYDAPAPGRRTDDGRGVLADVFELR